MLTLTKHLSGTNIYENFQHGPSSFTTHTPCVLRIAVPQCSVAWIQKGVVNIPQNVSVYTEVILSCCGIFAGSTSAMKTSCSTAYRTGIEQ